MDKSVPSYLGSQESGPLAAVVVRTALLQTTHMQAWLGSCCRTTQIIVMTSAPCCAVMTRYGRIAACHSPLTASGRCCSSPANLLPPRILSSHTPPALPSVHFR
jgi:hypothetical protein